MPVTLLTTRWKFKSCPHCIRGQMFLMEDGYDCLQCGFIEYKDDPLPFVGKKPSNKVFTCPECGESRTLSRARYDDPIQLCINCAQKARWKRRKECRNATNTG